SSIQIVLNRVVPAGNHITAVSGDGQTAGIDELLPAPLVVRVVDGAGAPLQGASVVFRVIQGDGTVGARSDASSRAFVATPEPNGLASARFTLGSRSGTGNQKVRASVVGIDNEVIFTASATGHPGNKLSVNSGNNQRGVAGQVLAEALVTV